MKDQQRASRGTKRHRLVNAQSVPTQTAKRCRLLSEKANKLCHNCRALDLLKAFTEADEFFNSNWDIVLGLRQRNEPEFTGIQVATLSNLMPPESGHCQLCKFLWGVRIRSSPDGKFDLRAFPSFWALPFIKISGSSFRTHQRRAQSSILAVVPAGMSDQAKIRAGLLMGSSAIFRSSSSDVTSSCINARQIPPLTDFGFLGDWIDFCSKNHGPMCPKHKGGKGAEKIKGFRLIDCKTRVVVKASVSRAFVALSYVWGVPGTPLANSLPWPRVVEDAITVTERLGHRYLWVDRYCIDQDDAQEKHQQIAKMHIIYHQAQFTIVAAAGCDATYGKSDLVQLEQETLANDSYAITTRLTRHKPPTSNPPNYLVIWPELTHRSAGRTPIHTNISLVGSRMDIPGGGTVTAEARRRRRSNIL